MVNIVYMQIIALNVHSSRDTTGKGWFLPVALVEVKSKWETEYKLYIQ